MQSWLTCVVGYISPTPPSLPHGMHNINIFKGLHGDINRYVKYKISVISSHYVGARLFYINEKTKKGMYVYIYVCVCSHICINKIQDNSKNMYIYIYCMYI